MVKLIVLGTAASVPDSEHDTIGLVLRGPDWAVPIDCGGSPLHKLARHGIALDEIRALVFTHRHADHLYGLPMLIQGLWLGGRTERLPVYGPAETLDVGRQLLSLMGLADQEGMFDLEMHPVPLREKRSVLKVGGVRISSSPVSHGKAMTLALRMDNAHSGGSVVYSADTEPCPSLVRLATGADLLIHEATGDSAGHSSPAQAADVAREAGVSCLRLIHYPVLGVDLKCWLDGARSFPGPFALAADGDVYEF